MIKRLKITNIRSIKNATFEFSEGVNLLIGPNGSGKTSILESIGLFGIGKLHSQTKDFRSVSFGNGVGRVEIEIQEDEREVVSTAAILEKTKVFKVNSNQIRSSKIIGFIKIVYFNPETIDLVSGSPKTRRGELDQIISQVEPMFVSSLLKFRKVLKERNSLLKRISTGLARREELDFWDGNICQLALEIYSKRRKFLDETRGALERCHKRLVGNDGLLGTRYLPSCDYDRFSEVIAANRDSDIRVNQTAAGPHRDDFEFFRTDMPHALYRDQASRGEQRLAAAAFKMAAADFLQRRSGTLPIIILDDIFSELDAQHRSLVADMVDGGQVFISATDEAVVPDKLLSSAHVIKVKQDG